MADDFDVTVSVELETLRDLEKRFDAMLRGVELRSPRALTDVGLDLLRRAVKLAPIEWGDLKSSGHLVVNGQEVARGTKRGGVQRVGSPGDGRGGRHTAEVAFEESYAIIQHEEIDFDHPRGGQAKYLEDPFAENIDRYIQHIRDAYSREIGG